MEFLKRLIAHQCMVCGCNLETSWLPVRCKDCEAKYWHDVRDNPPAWLKKLQANNQDKQ
jgi:hypothetical protein